jgi:hypothetical protein
VLRRVAATARCPCVAPDYLRRRTLSVLSLRKCVLRGVVLSASRADKEACRALSFFVSSSASPASAHKLRVSECRTVGSDPEKEAGRVGTVKGEEQPVR